MKRFFSITGVLVFSAFLFSSFSLRENPQDPPRGKKVEKHIKMVKVDDKGNKTELDTIVTNDRIFVWNGDTIGGKDLKWISKDINLDSLHKNMTFDFEFTDDEGENVFFVKPNGKDFSKSWSFVTEGDSAKEIRIEINSDDIHGDHDVMMWNAKPGNNRMIVAPDIHGLPHPPAAADFMFLGKDNENVIDLSDSGIISYKKKKMSGGREKITIIRNEPNEKNIKHVEEIIVDGKGDRAVFFGNSPKVNRVFVTKDNNGNVEVIENENVVTTKKGDETIKVIREDGKLIKIKETKKGNEKEVEVEVEVEEGGENN